MGAWHSFTRVTCQEISIKGTCDFLSLPYISYIYIWLRQNSSALFQRQIIIYCSCFNWILQTGQEALEPNQFSQRDNRVTARAQIGCYYTMIILRLKSNTLCKFSTWRERGRWKLLSNPPQHCFCSVILVSNNGIRYNNNKKRIKLERKLGNRCNNRLCCM